MEQRVTTGIDRVLLDTAELPRSARLGLLTNRAARTSSGEWTGTTLRACGYQVALLLTPEHGLTVEAAAGAPVGHSLLGDTPVLSLYGADLDPVEEALDTVDVLAIDLPDVGCRYYTYGWTVREVLKLAARAGKPVYCLDRPNPLDGITVEGSMPDPGYDSAVCASSVPVRHALTLGELALWQRVDLGRDVEIVVLTAGNWSRDLAWGDTRLPWTPPSPAMQTVEAAEFYPGTCLIEGTNVSEGRGTAAPFTTIGAPFLDGDALAAALRADEAFGGVTIEPIEFTPHSSKWADRACRGIQLTLRDRRAFRPVRAGLALVAALAAHPEFEFLPRQFDALAGTAEWRERLLRGETPGEIAAGWEPDESAFRVERERGLLY